MQAHTPNLSLLHTTTVQYQSLLRTTNAEPALGCTLMIPLGQYVSEDRDYAPKELFAFILMFQERIDAKFPCLYSWLDLKAAHVTLRGIMG